jgi:DNA-3-methyladenine glycosylase
VTLPRRAARLPVALFDSDAVTVARALLGLVLETRVRGVRAGGRIVEVEAYLGADDPASHAFRYRRHRQNQALFGPPGTWYVYRSYGLHWCANLVTGPPGLGAAVLLRALEPLEGLPAMRRRRGRQEVGELCAGPGRLTEALGIDRSLDGRPMQASYATIRADTEALGPAEIEATTRIGIRQAADWPLRFTLRWSPWLSRGGSKQRGRTR